MLFEQQNFYNGKSFVQKILLFKQHFFVVQTFFIKKKVLETKFAQNTSRVAPD